MAKANRYSQIIERIFEKYRSPGSISFEFRREDLENAAKELGIPLPKNLGDVLYSFRYRNDLPERILATAPAGETWLIRPAGRGVYRFALVPDVQIMPNLAIAETRIPDATPGIVAMYALSDEQALLAKLRYNRLIDMFVGVTCYSLQNHLRTTVPEVGQIETDELYVGVDRRGAHYVMPVQAKGGSDRLNVVQIEQDIALCADKFRDLICRPIGAQFIEPDFIALFAFELQSGHVTIVAEKHYRLLPPEQITSDDLIRYRQRVED